MDMISKLLIRGKLGFNVKYKTKTVSAIFSTFDGPIGVSLLQWLGMTGMKL